MQNLLRQLFFISVLKPLLLFILGMNVVHRENLPLKNLTRNEPFIMIANHNSHLDACALMNLFPLSQLEKIHPVAAADYFMTNPISAWISTTFLNIIPIPRTHLTKSNNPITRMSEAIEKGQSLIVFPEGSRGEPEVMQDFKSGVAHLIKRYPNIPVIPVFMKGMGKSLPKGEWLLIPVFCDVVIGKALYFNHESKDQIISQLQEAVQSLTHNLYEYSDRQ